MCGVAFVTRRASQPEGLAIHCNGSFRPSAAGTDPSDGIDDDCHVKTDPLHCCPETKVDARFGDRGNVPYFGC